ncbi:hypothetical protein BDZ97DRAFT_1927095 [Flammula alnicola]|nr:hypothetical protein BDZ97DRAFT_1927095 [Flammula alnicola]
MFHRKRQDREPAGEGPSYGEERGKDVAAGSCRAGQVDSPEVDKSMRYVKNWPTTCFCSCLQDTYWAILEAMPQLDLTLPPNTTPAAQSSSQCGGVRVFGQFERVRSDASSYARGSYPLCLDMELTVVHQDITRTFSISSKLQRSPLDFFAYQGGNNYDAACDYLLHCFISLNQSAAAKQMYAYYMYATDTQ